MQKFRGAFMSGGDIGEGNFNDKERQGNNSE